MKNLDALRNYLHSKNVQVIDDEARFDEGIKRFYVSDPFGNRIEFLELPIYE